LTVPTNRGVLVASSTSMNRNGLQCSSAQSKTLGQRAPSKWAGLMLMAACQDRAVFQDSFQDSCQPLQQPLLLVRLTCRA
jgi:hypothetical protein